MKKIYLFFSFLIFSIKSFAAWPLRDTVEFNQRHGLPIMIVGNIVEAPSAIKLLSDNSSDFICYSKKGKIILESKNQPDLTSEIRIYDANGRIVCREKGISQIFSSQLLLQRILCNTNFRKF